MTSTLHKPAPFSVEECSRREHGTPHAPVCPSIHSSSSSFQPHIQNLSVCLSPASFRRASSTFSPRVSLPPKEALAPLSLGQPCSSLCCLPSNLGRLALPLWTSRTLVGCPLRRPIIRASEHPVRIADQRPHPTLHIELYTSRNTHTPLTNRPSWPNSCARRFSARPLRSRAGTAVATPHCAGAELTIVKVHRPAARRHGRIRSCLVCRCGRV